MANTTINKIIYNGNTLIDLTGDTISAADVIRSKRFHLPSGEVSNGTCAYDADTSDATATTDEILYGKTAYVAGVKNTGTMPNLSGNDNASISTKGQQITIAQGYHDGSGKVGISSTEQAKIVPGNIKNGVTILGQTGTYTGESSENPQAKTVTPTASKQTITPDTASGYTCLSQVVVNAVPYVEADNAQGGKTVTIL